MATKETLRDKLEQRKIQKATKALAKAGIHLPAIGPVTPEQIQEAEEEAIG